MARKNEKIAKEARENASDWRGYFAVNNKQYHQWFEFVMGSQWTKEETDLFKTYKKTPLVFNKLAPLVNTLLGEQRQNTPNLEVLPDEDMQTPQVPKIREALVKDIAFDSKSKVVYQTAFSQALIGGFGAFMCYNDYESEYTFNQSIFIRRIKDPTKCFWDRSAEDESKTDGMFCGMMTRMNRKKFKAIYGAELEKKIGNIDGHNAEFTWSDNEGITILDYYKREYKTITMYQMSNGATLDQDELESLEKLDISAIVDEEDFDAIIGEKTIYLMNMQPVTIENERKAKRYTIKWFQLAGDYELDSGTVPGETLPIIFVDQNSFYTKDEKQICRPFMIDAFDSQKYINYVGTQSAYLLKTYRYDQFIMSKENARSEDTRQIWSDPQSHNGALYYDKATDGTVPQQLRPPELPQSLLTQYERALNDVYTSTGLYQARIGQQGNEVSGAAIDARTRQGNAATYVVFDSLNRAIATCGKIINEMIPYVYDTERVLSLMMPDSGRQTIVINQQLDEYGMQIANDIRKGSYTVRLVPGASFEGQKQQALESMNLVLQASPQIFPMIADLYAENLPVDNNIELRNRLRTLVPAEILEAGKTGQPLPPTPPEENPQAIMAKLKAQELEIKKQELMLKAQKQNAETQRELEQLELDRLEIAAQLEEQQMRYDAEMHRTRSDLHIAHADNLIKLLTNKQQ